MAPLRTLTSAAQPVDSGDRAIRLENRLHKAIYQEAPMGILVVNATDAKPPMLSDFRAAQSYPPSWSAFSIPKAL